jgi:nucleoside-diphosphate-sugar epimerase
VKILVTGATGFIGQYVIKELLKNSDNYIIATSSNDEGLSNIFINPRVKKIALNIFDYDLSLDLYDYFEKPDLLIHLAWHGLPNYQQEFHFAKNLPFDTRFLMNLIDCGLRDITVTGTCFEYGMQVGKLDESMESIPSNYYALAKDSLRRFLEIYTKDKNICFKWARLFYMYGNGQNPNSLISQLDKAIFENHSEFNMSGGEQIRDYLPVEDVARYIGKIALQKKVTGIINICSGNPQKLIDFINCYLLKKNKMIKLNLGYFNYSDIEPMWFWGDNSKLKLIS